MPVKLEKFMMQLAIGAGDILMKYFCKVRHIEHKLNAGIVTEADKKAEDYIVKKILRNFPDSSIITEESGKYAGDTELLWIIDPLDGTSNYAHGFPWFCVSIGLYENAKPSRGIIYHPTAKEIFTVARGRGAKLNGKRIRVSNTRQMNMALLGTGFYYSKGETLRDELEIFRRVNEKALGVRRPGSAALDLAYVACGRYDGFWERGLSSWDVAAGFLMVEEAGGRISDYGGKPTGIDDRETVASNGHLHTELVQLMGK